MPLRGQGAAGVPGTGRCAKVCSSGSKRLGQAGSAVDALMRLGQIRIAALSGGKEVLGSGHGGLGVGVEGVDRTVWLRRAVLVVGKDDRAVGSDLGTDSVGRRRNNATFAPAPCVPIPPSQH